MPGATHSSLHLVLVLVPARTTRSPLERQPVSWATCGNTPSSTGTSRWYVPPSGAPSRQWDPGVDPHGASQGNEGQALHPRKADHQNASEHRTGPPPHLPLLKGWGCPQSIIPLVAPAPAGWEQPRARRGDSVALSVPVQSGFVVPFPPPSEVWAGVSPDRKGVGGTGVPPCDGGLSPCRRGSGRRISSACEDNHGSWTAQP